MSEELDNAGVRDAVRHRLLQVNDDGRSTAVKLRTLARPETSSPAVGTDELERSLAALAKAVYPAFLMPLETPSIPGMPELAVLLEEADSRVPDLIASLPASRTFIAAIAADELIGKVFRSTHAVLGPFAQVYVNTGHGGPIALSRLPVLTLRAAWREVQDAQPTEDQFVIEALAQLTIVRRVLSGRTSKVRASLAFTGVLLPPDACIDLGDDGIVRSANDADSAPSRGCW